MSDTLVTTFKETEFLTIVLPGTAAPGGGGGSGTQTLRVTVSSPGQTVFTLPQVFTPGAIAIYFNGVRQNYPADWSLTGTTLTWLAAVPLSPADFLEVSY